MRNRWVLGSSGLLALALLAASVLVARAALTSSEQVVAPDAPVSVERDTIVATLRDAIRIPTVAFGPGDVDVDALAALQALLRERFPRVYTELKRTRFEEHSVLFEWKGRNPTLAPGLLLAHQDVVPVPPDAEWRHDPFGAVVEDGFLYGRGALDNKHNLIEQLAAVEFLLERGFAPQRTLYIGNGHDEEVAGSGARAMAAWFASRGTTLAYVLDEGGVVAEGVLPGLDVPSALVGVSEKGYVSLRLTARAPGGHSSMPPPTTAAGRIGAAVAALEANPLPASLDGPTGAMLARLSPEMNWPLRLVMANADVLSPLVLGQMTGKANTNATVRTTTAVTMLTGSVKDNVLPSEATAVVNFRIAPGDTITSVEEHVRATVGPDIEITRTDGIASDPAEISPAHGLVYDAIATAVRQTWSDAVVAPFLMVGATDGRHFTEVTDHVYRFSPVRVEGPDLKGIHGLDERISLQNVEDGTSFYVRFIEALHGGS